MLLLASLLFSGMPFACVLIQEVADQDELPRVYERVYTGVVTLHTVSSGPTVETYGVRVEQEGTGSGVVVSAEGEILTAAHVVQNADSVAVEFYDGTRLPAQIVSSDPLTDLAMVRLEGALPGGVAIARLGDSDQARIGSRVFVVGAPLGITHTLTVGHLSARRIAPSLVDAKEQIEVLQTDAAINPGNSGGPLFDLRGDVIGVVSFIQSVSGGSQGLGFAISAKTCRERFFGRLPLWTGMEYLSLRGPFAELLNLPEGKCGLLVQRVVSGSIADRLGLRGGEVVAEIQGFPLLLGGDIVLQVGTVEVGQPGARDEIMTLLGKLGPADHVEVRILRSGKMQTLRARWSELE